MKISMRQLDENDWPLLAAVRLKALKSDPSVFGSTFAAEEHTTEDGWRTQLRSKDSAIFVLFSNEKPIGMTGISVLRDDPTKTRALLWGSWLEPDYRRRGLSEGMYKGRIDWAMEHPTVESIEVSHRASNLASKYANQKHAFVLTGRREKLWVDGAIEDEVTYELQLQKNRK